MNVNAMVQKQGWLPLKTSRQFAYLAVLLNGACVLIVEIAGARLLAPYFGTALFIWTSAISVVLGALAFGYFLGSKLAVREALAPLIAKCFAAASVLTFVTPYLVYTFGDVVPSLVTGESFSFGVFFFALVGSLISLMPSGIFFGTISPLIIEMLGRDHPHPGGISGNVFAISTLGSIAGAILTPVVLFSLLGTHNSFVLVACLLMLLAACYASKLRYAALLAAILLAVIGCLTRPNPLETSGIVYAQETPYQHIRLFDRGDRYELVYNAGFGIQSVHPKETHWTGSYWDWLALIPLLRSETEKHAAVIGVAGGAVPRIWQATRAGASLASVDAVDIDGAVFDVVREYLDADLYGMNAIVKDGRGFLAATGKTYDVIFVDAYVNEYQIPFHLATVEFFQLAGERLTSDGILVLNVALGGETPLSKTIANTVASVYEYVYQITGNTSSNAIILASREPIDLTHLDALVKEAEIPSVNLSAERMSYIDGGSVFTDDYAPVELFSDFSLF